MSKQTAVEWLYDEFKPFLQDYSRGDIEDNKYFIRILTQAKAMEIDQMEEAFHESRLTKDFCVYLNSGFKHESFYAYYYEGGEQ